MSLLQNVPLEIHQRHTFDENTASRVQTIPYDIAKAIINTLFTLYLGQNAADVSFATYVEDIANALSTARPDAAEWNDVTLSHFKQRLTSLLNLDSLKLIAKAHDVMLEQRHAFHEARILTDIRPVFSENVEASPQAAVIVHTLKIEYMKDGDYKEFFVALDAKDIPKLIDVLKRAERKGESLKAVLASANVTYIDVL